jgi:hypothetical protein
MSTPSDDAVLDDGRDESEAERIDRNLDELLQELRVASVGVQVLFGFLLSLPFTSRFETLDRQQRALYLADLLLAALAITLLIAPAAHHRLSFRQREKATVLRRANVLAILGLLAVAIAISGSVLLVLSTVYSGVVVPLIAGLTAGTMLVVWFVLPSVGARRGDY